MKHSSSVRACALAVALLAACSSTSNSQDVPTGTDAIASPDTADTALPPTDTADPPMDAPAPGTDVTARDAVSGDVVRTAQATISDFVAYGNCMPNVPADPITTSWTLRITGSRGTAARVTAATLAFSGATSFSQALTLDVPSITLTGGSGSAMQRKTAGTPQPTNACGSLCSTTATIDLTVDDGVEQFTAHATTMFGCAL